jgi:lysozyme
MTPADLAALAKPHTAQFEGCRLSPYQDAGGVWTCGYGATGLGVHPGIAWTQEQADNRLEADLTSTASRLLEGAPWIATIDPVRASVLVDIAFNVGVQGLLHWPKTLGHFAAQNWPAAANDLLHEGKWNDDVKDRAVRLSRVTAAGTWSAA